MKRVLIAILAATVMVCSGCKKFDNKAVIKVDDESITKQEITEIVDRQMNNPLFAQLDKESANAKMLALLATDRAVNELIVKKMISGEIAKRNIKVTKDDIDEFKKKMIADIGSEENLNEVLKRNKLDEKKFNAMLKEDIELTKLINSISPIIVTDIDVKKFYNDNKNSKFSHPDIVKASHILIKDKAKAEKVLAMAKAPNADFAELAKQYSEDTSTAKRGGDLDFFAKEQMVKPFSDAAFSMKPDTVSDLIQTEFGYHIIKVTDRKKAGVTPFDEVKNEIKKYLEDEKKVQVLQKFIEGKKAQTKVVFIDNYYNPDNLKNEVQKLSKQNAIAPQPTEFPAPNKEGKTK